MLGLKKKLNQTPFDTYVLWDTETTGLVQPAAVPLTRQPKCIEFCAIKLEGDKLEEVAEIDFLANPGAPLPPEITKITGITDKDLSGKLPFSAHIEEVVEFFFGSRFSVAHNNPFDTSILDFELQRAGRATSFPWPPVRICTIEKSFYIHNRRMKLGELVEHCTGRALLGAHRAINDVRGMADCVRWLRKQKKL